MSPLRPPPLDCSDDHLTPRQRLVLAVKVVACVPLCVLAWGLAIPVALARLGRRTALTVLREVIWP